MHLLTFQPILFTFCVPLRQEKRRMNLQQKSRQQRRRWEFIFAWLSSFLFFFFFSFSKFEDLTCPLSWLYFDFVVFSLAQWKGKHLLAKTKQMSPKPKNLKPKLKMWLQLAGEMIQTLTAAWTWRNGRNWSWTWQVGESLCAGVPPQPTEVLCKQWCVKLLCGCVVWQVFSVSNFVHRRRCSQDGCHQRPGQLGPATQEKTSEENCCK